MIPTKEKKTQKTLHFTLLSYGGSVPKQACRATLQSCYVKYSPSARSAEHQYINNCCLKWKNKIKKGVKKRKLSQVAIRPLAAVNYSLVVNVTVLSWSWVSHRPGCSEAEFHLPHLFITGLPLHASVPEERPMLCSRNSIQVDSGTIGFQVNQLLTVKTRGGIPFLPIFCQK